MVVGQCPSYVRWALIYLSFPEFMIMPLESLVDGARRHIEGGPPTVSKIVFWELSTRGYGMVPAGNRHADAA